MEKDMDIVQDAEVDTVEISSGEDNAGSDAKPYRDEVSLLMEIERLKRLLLEERIKVALAESGIEAKKISRVARLIDASKVSVDGEIDKAAFDKEIEDIFIEFPELKAKPNDVMQGFRIGSDGMQKESTNDKIWSIFGNK